MCCIFAVFLFQAARNVRAPKEVNGKCDIIRIKIDLFQKSENVSRR